VSWVKLNYIFLLNLLVLEKLGHRFCHQQLADSENDIHNFTFRAVELVSAFFA